MASYPQFAAGPSTKIQDMVDSGTLRYPAYVFATDNKKYYFIGKDNVVSAIEGDCPHYVYNVDELPETGDPESLYIMDGIVYVWTGTEFKAQYEETESIPESVIRALFEEES